MQVNLDRFAQGPEDTVGMDPEPYAVCENCDCGQEIYPGERYFEAFTGEITLITWVDRIVPGTTVREQE